MKIAESPAAPEPETDARRTGTCVTFDLAGQRFAVDVADVREILDRHEIARMPGIGGDAGVIDNRGESVPIIDLAARLGLAGGEAEGDETRIIVFEQRDGAGGARPVGVVADRVLNVCEIAATDIEPPPESGEGGAIAGLLRLEGRLVFLLRLQAALGGAPGPWL
jgi:purine-binding chemotaxis protein CheW